MTYRYVLSMKLQYPAVQDALGADAWLATWKAQNFANVRPAGTTQDAHAVIPPTPPPDPFPDDWAPVANQPANGELTFTLHLEGADEAEVQGLRREVQDALARIRDEGGVFDCIGDSGVIVSNPE